MIYQIPNSLNGNYSISIGTLQIVMVRSINLSRDAEHNYGMRDMRERTNIDRGNTNMAKMRTNCGSERQDVGERTKFSKITTKTRICIRYQEIMICKLNINGSM